MSEDQSSEVKLEIGRRATAGLPVSRDVMVGGSYLISFALADSRFKALLTKHGAGGKAAK